MANDKVLVFEDKMKKTVSVFENELNSVRVGRANPHVLDRITVNYYGVPTAIQQVGNISVPEARIIQIQPWDVGLLKEIEKAIQSSDLGINPTNDGKIIRLVFPELTEERRKDLTKEVKKKGEDAKIAIRNIRRDAVEGFKKSQKSSDITEDDLKVLETEIQKMTDKYVVDIEKIVEKKDKEILSV